MFCEHLRCEETDARRSPRYHSTIIAERRVGRAERMDDGTVDAHGLSGVHLLSSIILGAVPMILTQCMTQLIIILTVMRLGRESPDWLAGASLGGLVFNLAGLMLTVAPVLAMESVAPQAFGGGRLAEVGLIAQRAALTALLFLAPAAFLWIFSERILLALGQPPLAANLASSFLHVLVPALPLNAVFEATRKFLYAQNCSGPPLYAGLLALALHPLWQELTIRAFGFIGGPLALVITHATMSIGLLIFCACRKPHVPGTWPGLQPRTILADQRACCQFLGLSLAALGSLSEWVFWEFVTFRAGRFGPVQLAAHGVAYSLLPLLYMVPLGSVQSPKQRPIRAFAPD